MAVSLFTAANAQAQNPAQMALKVIKGQAQKTTVTQPFSERLTVQLTDDQGLPFSGAPVWFGNDGCVVYDGITVPCGLDGEPGHIESGAQVFIVLTDSSGIATAPIYIAGSTPGTIGVGAFPMPETAPFFFPIGPSLNNLVVFTLFQVVAVAKPVPLFSIAAVIAVALLLMFTALLAIRGRRAA